MAGERSGNLDAVLRRFVAYAKVIDTVRSARRSRRWSIRPSSIALAVVLVGIIVLKVVPAFSEFYASFDAELPLSTRIIVALSDFVRGNLAADRGRARSAAGVGVLRLGPAARAAGALRSRCCSAAGRRHSVHKFATSQMARTLATLLGGGIPLVNALEIARARPATSTWASELEVVGAAGARRAELRGDAARAPACCRTSPIKMIEVGESTGALQEMLNSLADFYDEEIETEVGRFVTLIEPVLLIIMGIVIAVVVLALYLPLFELTSVIGA